MSVNKLIVLLSVAYFIGAAQGLPQESVAIMMQFQQTCIDTSGFDEGYRQLLVSLEPAKSCLLNRLNVQQLQLDMKLVVSGSRKQFFDKYCPQLHESLSCFEDAFEGVAKCAGNDTDQVMVLIKEMSHGFLDVLCRNDGQMFFDIQKPEIGACIGEVVENSQDCEVSNITSKTPITGFGEQQCREFEESRECLKGKVEDCQVPGVFDVFDVVYSTISKANDCNQYTIVNEITSNEVDGI
ncbi:27 kDa glycoprotein-like [Ochlerotatus camptorhynchus]|uniref:27 kDa glycoprotein-like n=1 Tax=Ochlerotatus camptorhynchus TaxID=644619 RepID=UPI0031D77C9A